MSCVFISDKSSTTCQKIRVFPSAMTENKFERKYMNLDSKENRFVSRIRSGRIFSRFSARFPGGTRDTSFLQSHPKVEILIYYEHQRVGVLIFHPEAKVNFPGANVTQYAANCTYCL
jgi:hypothetical protein